jgi:hypothetical protein
MERARRNPVHTGWKRDAEAWLSSLPIGRTFTADDLVAYAGKPDVGSPNVIGAWLAAQSKRGRIAWTGGFQKSSRPEGHSNLQRVWRVVASSP